MDKTSTQNKISFHQHNQQEKNNIDNMNDSRYEPGEHVINTILNYSKSLEIKKSEMITYIETVLN